jgi:hypothetical protein
MNENQEQGRFLSVDCVFIDEPGDQTVRPIPPGLRLEHSKALRHLILAAEAAEKNPPKGSNQSWDWGQGVDATKNMSDFDDEIELAREHLVKNAYEPIACVDFFTRGASGEILVMHFSKESPKLPCEEHLTYYDTPSTIVIALDLRTGKFAIPELI